MSTTDFLVLGDLTERELGVYVDRSRTLIVRMFIGDATYDEEITVDNLDVARDTIAARMTELAATPDKTLLVEAERPTVETEHAIVLPPVDDQAVKL